MQEHPQPKFTKWKEGVALPAVTELQSVRRIHNTIVTATRVDGRF